jgi:hypothetical protein
MTQPLDNNPFDDAADVIANALTEQAFGLTTPKAVARQINAIFAALHANGLTITRKESK